MANSFGVEALWDTKWEAARLFTHGATVRSASRIAVVVGTWLCALNQGRAIVDGNVPWLKVALNYLTPFVVASLGYLAAHRRRNFERLARTVRSSPD